MSDEEVETLTELREAAREQYDALQRCVTRALRTVRVEVVDSERRGDAVDDLNAVMNSAAALFSLLTDTWQQAEKEAERYHRMIEEWEDAHGTT